MKKMHLLILTWAALLFVPGCNKPVYIEKQQFVLIEGIDLDEHNKLVVYTSSPVFSKEAKEKYKITSATAHSMRDSKAKINSKTIGSIAYGKTQTVLIGKKLLLQRNAFPYLDVLFRDPRNEINANVIVVNGTVKEVMYANMSDKGRIGVVINDQAESTFKNSNSVQTSLQQFHKQMLDKRATPYLSEMKVEKNDLVMSGTALLHKDGTYAASLNNKETSLLLLIQRNTKNTISLTFHLDPKRFHTDEEMSYVSFDIKKVKYNLKTKFAENHFTIDMQMKVQINLSERMFSLDLEKKSKQLEQAISQELTKECNALIKKAQKHQVAPFGFGHYVRAHDYKNWKKVQDDWGKALSEATVNISTKVIIKNIGVTE
ncbi:germination protein [Paenibacillus baekrokdamisoli]|uniref:Germination protein n=1 Tax=Paenibacillus baekrokdamisoli TaxID=1712516 RepID=A0A3G9JMI2_9BACL|nr:Ger(x)C family spore germination protein [Paenibacillus baekrokdamisoli]MBB3071933.1 Ger(x)C family germination protein [Paenibacillus baekrokdamisoli]BBH24084.1 germination protein [Paenibacillus baekrokdamisoli]